MTCPHPHPAFTSSPSPLPFQERPLYPELLVTHLPVMFLQILPNLLDLQRNNRDHTGRWSMEVGKDLEFECCACFSPAV